VINTSMIWLSAPIFILKIAS